MRSDLAIEDRVIPQSFSLPIHLIVRIQEQAKFEGKPVSSIARKALRSYLVSEEKNRRANHDNSRDP